MATRIIRETYNLKDIVRNIARGIEGYDQYAIGAYLDRCSDLLFNIAANGTPLLAG
ncbi:unnamed protein product, partial [Dovyalis caffra]